MDRKRQERLHDTVGLEPGIRVREECKSIPKKRSLAKE